MAFKYKIQILGGSSVINTVNAGDLNNPVSTATFNTKDLSASVNGGNVDITNLAADKVVLSNIPYADIINSGNFTWGGTASQVVTNLNLEFKVSAHTIGEIQGVTITGTPDATYQGKGLVFDGAGNLTVSSSVLLNTSYSPPPQIETDPVFTASPAFSITNTKKSNWDTAYSWGDHAAAGYVTAASETLATITGRGATTTTTSIIPFNYANQAAFPSSSTYKGAIAYSDADKAMFVATGTSWLRIANQTEVFDRRYTSLTNVPTSFTPAAHTQAWSTITNTPTTIAGYGIADAFDGDYNSLSNLPTLLQLGTTSTTALAGDTTTITTAQANAIVANTAKVSFPGFGTTAGTALEGNTALFDGNYASLSNIPPTFTPSAHTHTASEITDFDTEVSNNTSVAANTAKVGYTDAAVDLRIAAASIGDLSDVPTTMGTAGQVLAVNAGATALEYVAQTGGGAVSIDDLTDVDTSTVAPSTGQALVWDGTQWEPGTVSGGGSSLWTASGSDIYYTTGNVGVGTTTPAEALDVSGKADIKDSSNNVLISTGNSTITASNTVAVGYQAGTALTTGGSNILIGYQAGSTLTTESNKLYIENSNSTTPLIYGEFDTDILRVNGTLQVNDPASTGYSFPTATGTLGQVLEVDASGDLVFATPSGGGSGGLGTADQTLTGDRLIDTNGFNLAIELDPTGTADTFTIHDGTHDLFQVDTSTTGTLFSVNDVSGLPKLEVDEDEGVIAKSIKVDDSALTVAGQYGKGAEIWYQGTSTPTAGSVYYLDSSGNWANTDASAVATAKGMLSVSAGTDSDVDGMVIKGFVYVGTDPGGNVGDVVYLSETANQLTTTAPTTASAVVRVCGYKVGTNIVYFDPSKDWIELS